MAKSKATSRCLLGSDDGCVLECTWHSSRLSSPWHGASQDQSYSAPYVPLPIVTFVHRRIFWAFDVLPAAERSNIDPTKTVNRGTTREPAPFQFRLRTRHPDAERIIESESADADLRLKEWEY
jgi:hypothetical protein